MSTRRRPTVTRDALRLAAEAEGTPDPRTCADYLAGRRPRGRVADRLDEAARRLGININPPRSAA